MPPSNQNEDGEVASLGHAEGSRHLFPLLGVEGIWDECTEVFLTSREQLTATADLLPAYDRRARNATGRK